MGKTKNLIFYSLIHKHPVKCLLTEKIQNKYFDHAFFVNFAIVYMKMIICHIPWLPWSRTQANHKGEVSIYIFFFFFFFFFLSDECCPKCDLEKINHCVKGVAPVSIYRDWLASRYQTQSCQSCSSLMPRAKNFKVWIWLFFPSYKLLILYPTVSDPM